MCVFFPGGQYKLDFIFYIILFAGWIKSLHLSGAGNQRFPFKPLPEVSSSRFHSLLLYEADFAWVEVSSWAKCGSQVIQWFWCYRLNFWIDLLFLIFLWFLWLFDLASYDIMLQTCSISKSMCLFYHLLEILYFLVPNKKLFLFSL